ncbi:exosome nuclease subunit [Coemansia sp. RSA 1200]|nr:exosome nuclease subunit [Coemansia sp. RSA 1200]
MSVSSSSDIVKTFDTTVAAAYAALLKATRAANRLPSDIKFHRTVDEALDRKLEVSGQKTLEMANTLWRRMGASGGNGERGVESVDDVAARGSEEGAWVAGPGFRAAVDAVDSLLERIDAGIDEIERRPAHALRASAAAKADGAVVGAQSAAVVTAVADADGRRTSMALVHAKNIPRPQLRFHDSVDNSRGTPFVPRLRDKPHALVPLAEPAGAEQDAPHPYAHEIAAMQQPPRHFEARTPTAPGDWDGTPFEMVDSEPQLRGMMEHLRGADEIAVDLEHHNYRSYQGFTCLVQISTRARDYVVDALALRHALHVLNEVTADPRKTKVFHGAESDIQWLQRDFGVYVVGLFDTYHASRVLGMPHHSLAHLLRVYCAYDADKKYQLADWRLRPLPAEMVRYARADTHFLLYVYDRLRNELAERGAECLGQDADNPSASAFGRLAGVGVVSSPAQPMALVLRRSAQTALRTYAKDAYGADGPGGWSSLLHKWRRPMTRAQTAAFRALHDWRDQCARAEDESTRYVLPNHMLFAVAERIPADAPALLAMCRPTPPLVRQHAGDIARILARARADAELEAAGSLPSAAPLPPMPKPLHTRFNDDGEAGAEAMNVDDVLSPKPDGSAVAGLLAPVSALFGPSLGAGAPLSASVASDKAREIRAHLVLASAAPASVHSFSPPSAARAPASAAPAAPAPASPSLPSPKRPLVISDAYGRQSSGERSPQGAGAKRQRVGDLVDISKIVLDDGEDDDDDDGNSDGSESPTTAAAAAAVKGGAQQKRSRRKKPRRLDPADVSAFDYHAGGQPSDAIGSSNGSNSRNKGKGKDNGPRGKKRAPGSSDSAAFNPYAASAGSSAHAPKKRSKPGAKTGNRSMTFRK